VPTQDNTTGIITRLNRLSLIQSLNP